jgi:hypothetical protein
MMQYTHLKHQFVKHIPKDINPGILYISVEYGTAVHTCCCGCGQEVVTPFTPTDWKLTYDGESISLYPSIGNWSLSCRSHYVIMRGSVIEAGPWSDEQIASERLRDRLAKSHYYGSNMQSVPDTDSPPQTSKDRALDGIWQRIWSLIIGNSK